MTFYATLLSILSSLWTLITGIRHKDVATQMANEANRSSQASADIARQHAKELNADLFHVTQDQAADSVAVRAADSLREQSRAVQDAIDRANGDV